MAAGRIVVPPYFPARDRNGLLVSGAKLYVYQNKTNTPVTIYADEGLTTPRANPVEANSSGQFAQAWAEAGTEDSPVLYSVAVTTMDGKSPGNPFVFDDYRPSVDFDTATAALAESAAASAHHDAGRAEVAADTAERIADDLGDIETAVEETQQAAHDAQEASAAAQAAAAIAWANTTVIDTRTLALAADVPPVVNVIQTRGFAAVDDEGGAPYVRRAAQPVMPSPDNSLTNPQFIHDDTGWAHDGDWTIDGAGGAVLDGTDGLEQDTFWIAPVEGADYRLVVEVSGFTDGALVPRILDGGDDPLWTGAAITSAGVHVVTVAWPVGGVKLALTPGAASDLSVARVELRHMVQVPGSFQSADGAWWEPDPEQVHCRMLGLDDGMSATQARETIQATLDLAGNLARKRNAQVECVIPSGGQTTVTLWPDYDPPPGSPAPRNIKPETVPAWLIDDVLRGDSFVTVKAPAPLSAGVRLATTAPRDVSCFENRNCITRTWAPQDRSIRFEGLFADGDVFNRSGSIGPATKGCGFALSNVLEPVVDQCFGLRHRKHGIDLSSSVYPGTNSQWPGGLTNYPPGPTQRGVVRRSWATLNGDDGIGCHGSTDLLFQDCVSYNSGKINADNSNNFEVDDGCRKVTLERCYGWGGHRGIEIKGHSDAPAASGIIIRDCDMRRCAIPLNLRHISVSNSATAQDVLIDGGYFGDVDEELASVASISPEALEIQSYRNVRTAGSPVFGNTNGIPASGQQIGDVLTNMVNVYNGAADVDLDIIIRDAPTVPNAFTTTSSVGMPIRIAGAIINAGRTIAVNATEYVVRVGRLYVKPPLVTDAGSRLLVGVGAGVEGVNYDTRDSAYELVSAWNLGGNILEFKTGSSPVDGSAPLWSLLFSLASSNAWTPGAKYAGLAFGNADGSGAGNGGIKSYIAAFVPDSAGNGGGMLFGSSTDGTSVADRWALEPAGHLLPVVNAAYDIGSPTVSVRRGYFERLTVSGLPEYADNASAAGAGLVAGDLYRTATGQVMVVYA